MSLPDLPILRIQRRRLTFGITLMFRRAAGSERHAFASTQRKPQPLFKPKKTPSNQP